ncbi:MAG: hypothetical protein K8J31_27790 [Anaerolineae bacterium]|nr:hypothetical protein [Anaerolineae bacterium]
MNDIVEPVRLNYYKNQLLEAEDFILEQDYHRQMRYLHNQHLHTPGILWGFDKVNVEKDGKIVVSAGAAYDADGHEIVWAEGVARECVKEKWNELYVGTIPKDETRSLTIHWHEEKVTKDGNQPSIKDEETPRYLERPAFMLEEVNKETGIILAQITRKADGTFEDPKINPKPDKAGAVISSLDLGNIDQVIVGTEETVRSILVANHDNKKIGLKVEVNEKNHYGLMITGNTDEILNTIRGETSFIGKLDFSKVVNITEIKNKLGINSNHFVDTFISQIGQTLSVGDVVKLSGTVQVKSAKQGDLPLAGVVLCDQNDDTAVIGIVDRLPPLSPDELPGVENGELVTVVTLGVYPKCRVETMDGSEIKVGDLLSTSAYQDGERGGFARKAPSPSVGTVIAKALGSLASNQTGYVPVFVTHM